MLSGDDIKSSKRSSAFRMLTALIATTSALLKAAVSIRNINQITKLNVETSAFNEFVSHVSRNFIVDENDECAEGEIDLRNILKLIKCGSGTSVALKKQKIKKM